MKGKIHTKLMSTQSERFPDFLIAGVAKAGTTSLSRHLNSHPEIFIHVKDVAGLMLHLAFHGNPGAVYNLGFQPALRQQDFVRMLARLSGKEVKRKPLWWMKLRHEKAIAEAFSFSLDVRTKHPEVLEGYQPTFPDLESGLREVLQEEGMIR